MNFSINTQKKSGTVLWFYSLDCSTVLVSSKRIHSRKTYTMKTSLRPPTKRMIEKLEECYEKQTVTEGRLPCLPEELKSSLAGLYKRGYIGTKMEIINHKKLLCIYVTDSGKNFLCERDNRKNN